MIGLAIRGLRARWVSLIESPMYARAQAWSARWGVLAVPMSFLTVGLQSFIQISTGVARMPLHRYAAATAAGAIAWASVYTTIGMAILTAWITGPIGRIVCLLTVAVLVVIVVIRGGRVVRDNQGSRRGKHL